MADKDGLLEEFANWGGGTKTARPASVGPHHRQADQHDPNDPGIKPEQGYKPAEGDNNNNIGSDAPGGPVNIRVKSAEGDAPGQPDELAEPDNGVTAETKAKTTGTGKAGV